MKLSFVTPRPELRPYIESLWVFESRVGLPAAESNLAAPNGCCKLTFAYGNSFVSITKGRATTRPAEQLNFVGTRDSAIVLQSSPRPIGCIGIEFRPHGAFPFLGMPIEVIRNFLGDADVVWGRWARDVQDVLNSLQSVDQRVAFLQEQLVRQLRKNQGGAGLRTHGRRYDLVGHCVRALEATDGRIPIRELQRTTGYSRRYLELLFQQYVGLSPKVLAGILRFQRFYLKWAQGLSFDLFKDDLYAYFYDQSHFTKEFQRMTGHAPREYFQKVRNEFGRLRSLH